ncbi:hypothetical protein SRIMM317S_02770 [Streptomyces rimosus subsp. rimosus]
MIVAGTRCPDVLDDGVLDARIAEALRAARRRARMVSLCTGAFVLAAAGLLEGHRAATHWRYADRFRRLFPAVELDIDPLYVADRGVLTSAGGAAAIDLCLHLIREDHGSSVANRIARYNVVAPMREEQEQAQYIDRPVPEDAGMSTAAARALMTEHLDRRLSLKDLAAHCHMSVRTFAGRFRQETGIPGRMVRRRPLAARTPSTGIDGAARRRHRRENRHGQRDESAPAYAGRAEYHAVRLSAGFPVGRGVGKEGERSRPPPAVC